MKSRDFDALIAHLGELGVLDREDLMLMHLIPSHERLSYLRDRAPASVDQWLHRENSSDDSVSGFATAGDLDGAAKMEGCLSQMETANCELARVPERLHTCGTCGKELGLVFCVRDGSPVCEDCLFSDKVCPSCKRVFHHSVDLSTCPVCRIKLVPRKL
jgi:hypothetical protein